MAEEIIREMRNPWELYDVIQQIYPSPDALHKRALPGHEAFWFRRAVKMSCGGTGSWTRMATNSNSRSSWFPTPT